MSAKKKGTSSKKQTIDQQKKYCEQLNFKTKYVQVQLNDVATIDLLGPVKSINEQSLKMMVTHLQNGILEHSTLLVWEPDDEQRKELSDQLHRNTYCVVDGFKRVHAAKALGITQWGAIVLTQPGSVENIRPLLKKVVVACATANKLVDYFSFTELAELYCSLIPKGKNINKKAVTEEAYSCLKSQCGAVTTSKDYFRKVVLLWKNHFTDGIKDCLKQLEKLIPPTMQVFSESFCVHSITNVDNPDKLISLEREIKATIDSLKRQFSNIDKNAHLTIAAIADAELENLRRKVTDIYKTKIDRTAIENIRQPTSADHLKTKQQEVSNLHVNNDFSKNVFDKLQSIMNGSEDNDEDLALVDDQNDENSQSTHKKLPRKRQISDSDSNDEDDNAETQPRNKRPRYEVALKPRNNISLANHLSSKENINDTNKNTQVTHGKSINSTVPSATSTQQGLQSTSNSQLFDSSYPFTCTNGKKFKTADSIDVSWHQHKHLLLPYSVDQQTYRDCLTPALENLLTFWNYDCETNIFCDALQPSNCLVFINAVRSPQLKVDTVRQWVGSNTPIAVLQDYDAGSNITYTLTTYNVKNELTAHVNIFEGTTSKTLYHDVALCIAILLKQTAIKRVVHLDSGDDVELAVEMAARNISTDLPNASHNAVSNFCYQFWEHYFLKVQPLPPIVDDKRPLLDTAQIEQHFYCLLELHQWFITRPKQADIATTVKRLRNALLPGFRFATARTQVDSRKILSLPFTQLDQILPDDVRSTSNFFQLTASARWKMFHRITIALNESISINQSSYDFYYVAINLTEAGMTHAIMCTTDNEQQALNKLSEKTKTQAEQAGLKVLTLYPGEILIAKSTTNITLVPHTTNQLLLQWDVLPMTYLFEYGHNWLYESKPTDEYCFEDIYFSNAATIQQISASNKLYLSINNSMQALHNKVNTAAALPTKQKLDKPGICANNNCEKMFSHYALYCSDCDMYFCVYCDVIHKHNKKHSLIFSAK